MFMASYYRIIGGQRYDRGLLDRAETLIKGQGDGRISVKDIQDLYNNVLDAGKITPIESKTLFFIAEKYPISEAAIKWLKEQKLPATDLSEAVERIVRKQFGLTQVNIDIPVEVVDQQSKYPGNIEFTEALVAALESLDDPRQWNGFLLLNTLWPNDDAIPDQTYLLDLMDEWRSKSIDQGTVFLYSGDKVPPRDNRKLEDYWIFGFYSENFSEYYLFAFIHRQNNWDRQLKAFLTPDFHLSERIEYVAGNVIVAPDMEIGFDVNAINVHYQKYENYLEFEAVFYYALMFGLSNGESSISFRDLANQEFWFDYEDPESFDQVIRRFLNESKVFLVPPKEQLDQFPFQLPAWVGDDISSRWYFVVQPKDPKGYFVLLNMDRKEQDRYAQAWSDTYYDEDNSDITDNIDLVIRNEFGLKAIQIDIDPVVFESQHQKYDPDWRNSKSVLRQVINTLKGDYLNPDSFYNIALEQLTQEDPEYYDDPVKMDDLEDVLNNHLETAMLSLLAEAAFDKDLPVSNPLSALSIEEYYVFSLATPSFEKSFLVKIPRYPGYESRPENFAL